VKERERMFIKIKKRALAYGVCAVTHGEIDRINILQASLLAMQRAVSRLNVKPDLILVDGNKIFNSSIPCVPVIDGDAKSFSVAAASILAKVTRDHIMKRLCVKFPDYLWSKNKGYATAEHIRAIKEHGPCCLHRKTFLNKILYSDLAPEFNFEMEEPVE
jgi:ribonuclease HII